MHKSMKYLPIFMRKSLYLQELINALELVNDDIRNEIKDLDNQLYISKATWMLDYYEEELGIEKVADKPIDERRQLIMSKWRGTGNVNAEMIRDIVESYIPNLEADGLLIEFVDSTIRITFTSLKGVPANIQDCENSIREIMPCHLALEFVFRYNSWAQIEATGNTWSYYETNNITWENLQTI